MDPINTLLLFLLGGFTGVLSGYLGIGGGIVLVPILTEIFNRKGIPINTAMTAAFATSLTTAIVTTGSSAWQQLRQDNLIKQAIPFTAVGAIFGGQIGAWLGSNLTGDSLRLSFALFLLLAAVYLIIEPKKENQNSEIVAKSRYAHIIAGFVTGIFAALFGVGGGILMVPVFIFIFRYPAGKVAGTSSAIAFPIAVSAVIGYLFFGSGRALGLPLTVGVVDLGFALPVSGGTLLLAPFGAKLNRRFGGGVYRRVFGAFLVLISLRMLFA